MGANGNEIGEFMTPGPETLTKGDQSISLMNLQLYVRSTGFAIRGFQVSNLSEMRRFRRGLQRCPTRR